MGIVYDIYVGFTRVLRFNVETRNYRIALRGGRKKTETMLYYLQAERSVIRDTSSPG
jgi:hypothetical protein